MRLVSLAMIAILIYVLTLKKVLKSIYLEALPTFVIGSPRTRLTQSNAIFLVRVEARGFLDATITLFKSVRCFDL